MPVAFCTVTQVIKSTVWAWLAAGTLAISCAVAAVLMVTRAPGLAPTVQPGSSLAQAAASGVATQVSTLPVSTGSDTTFEAQSLVANGTQIRDARLDRYLAAHKQFAGSSALGVPSVFLRSATSDASNR